MKGNRYGAGWTGRTRRPVAVKAEPEWRGVARGLATKGLSVQAIASTVGLSYGAVRRFFEMDLGENAIVCNGSMNDEFFIEKHRPRTVRKIDMGPVVGAAREAVAERAASHPVVAIVEPLNFERKKPSRFAHRMPNDRAEEIAITVSLRAFSNQQMEMEA